MIHDAHIRIVDINKYCKMAGISITIQVIVKKLTFAYQVEYKIRRQIDFDLCSRLQNTDSPFDSV